MAVLGRQRHSVARLVTLLGPEVGLPPEDAPVVELHVDDRLPPLEAASRALDVLNRRLCFGPGPLVVVHAAALARRGRTAVLFGASGAGKSTLAAALTRAGWAYLSDEGAGIDGDARIHPYARALRIRTTGGGDEYIAPEVLGAVCRQPLPPFAFVHVRFERNALTRLDTLSRAESVVRVVLHCGNLAWFGRDGLVRLVQAIGRSQGYELVFGEVGDAVASIDGLDPDATR